LIRLRDFRAFVTFVTFGASSTPSLPSTPSDVFLPFRDAQLRELRSDILSRRGGFHRLVDMQDLAVRSDVEGPSVGEAHAAGDSVGITDGFGGIRQDWVIRFDMLRELLVGLLVVKADCVVGDVELPDAFAALTERLAFGGSSTGEGFGKPGQHDGALAFVVGELVQLAVRSLQTEWGRGIAHVQLGTRLLPEADDCASERERSACCHGQQSA
jgi:hypothetical protein